MEEPAIIFENRDFVIVNKPAGIIVHPVRVSVACRAEEVRAAEPTLTDWLITRYPEMKCVGDDPVMRPGIVHRLDKATSGVMVVARNQAAFERLKRLFQEHRMRKTYFALVHGVPKRARGTIDAPIGIRSGTLKRSIHSSKMARSAVTDYSVEKIFEKERKEQYALLKVMPKTGRTHQIRVHLASIGHPIVGDVLYGKKSAKNEEEKFSGCRLMLHAASLAFSDNAGNSFDFEAPLPAGFSRLSTGGIQRNAL
jgi:23S rRNA pseudouridine1911/1915/1917 synthase